MKIGIISDTHDNTENIEKAINIFNKKKAGLVIHCGDWTSVSVLKSFSKLNSNIRGVFGNCDHNKQDFLNYIKKNNLNIEILDRVGKTKADNKKIAVFHGDNKAILNSLIESDEYDVVLSGHTHKSQIETTDKTLHINPGCCSGQLLMNKVKPSIAIYDSKTNKAKIIKF